MKQDELDRKLYGLGYARLHARRPSLGARVIFWALVVAGALLWALAVYGYTILALVGSGAWLIADRMRRPG